MNSMVAFAAFGVFAPLLGLLAEQTSTQVAMVTAGAVSIVGAWFYLPARRAEKARSRRAQPSPRACERRGHSSRARQHSIRRVASPSQRSRPAVRAAG